MLLIAVAILDFCHHGVGRRVKVSAAGPVEEDCDDLGSIHNMDSAHQGADFKRIAEGSVRGGVASYQPRSLLRVIRLQEYFQQRGAAG